MRRATSSKLNTMIVMKNLTLALAALLVGFLLNANQAVKAGENNPADKTPPPATTVQFAAQKFHVAESAELAIITNILLIALA